MPDLPATRLTTAVVAIGGTYDDQLEFANDRDWIGVDLVAGETYQLSVSARGATPLTDPEMSLFDPLGGLLAYNDDAGAGLDAGLTYTALQTGRHYIEAAALDGVETGGYRVAASLTQAPGPLQSIDWGSQVAGSTVRVFFAPAGVSYEGYTGEGFNAYERARFEAAFEMIEAVTNLSFEVVTSEAQADFRLLLDTNQVSGFLAYFNPPGVFNEGIGVFDGSAWSRAAGGDLDFGGTGFVTITHELLHGLGLAHPHDFGGGSGLMAGVFAEYEDYGDFDLNQGLFTTMSYNSGYHTGPAGSDPVFSGYWGFEAGPMALDIAILQEKYGANMSTATGNDIYVLDGANGPGTAWQAIWDAGGYDEIRAPDNQPVTIDLRPPTFASEAGGGGHISAVTGIAGGYTIAGGVVIEVARGGGGNDVLIGNDAGNVLRGGGGADQMTGGLGNDFYYVDHAGDQVLGEIAYSQGGGIDTVRSFIDYTQPENIELVRLGFVGDTVNLNATGNDAPGTLVGNAGANVLLGRGGNDQINGNGGDDTLTGNTGVDTLVGGAGADVFVYTAYADSRAGAAARDVINGLDRGADVIDLSGIDANTGVGGNQAFAFIGTAGFSGAGQVRLQGLGGANAVLVEADHNGDGTADLQIFVNLTTVLGAGDFIL